MFSTVGSWIGFCEVIPVRVLFISSSPRPRNRKGRGRCFVSILFYFNKPHFFAPFITVTTRINLRIILLYVKLATCIRFIFALVCSNTISLSKAAPVLHIVARTDWRIQKKWDGARKQVSTIVTVAVHKLLSLTEHKRLTHLAGKSRRSQLYQTLLHPASTL